MTTDRMNETLGAARWLTPGPVRGPISTAPPRVRPPSLRPASVPPSSIPPSALPPPLDTPTQATVRALAAAQAALQAGVPSNPNVRGCWATLGAVRSGQLVAMDPINWRQRALVRAKAAREWLQSLEADALICVGTPYAKEPRRPAPSTFVAHAISTERRPLLSVGIVAGDVWRWTQGQSTAALEPLALHLMAIARATFGRRS